MRVVNARFVRLLLVAPLSVCFRRNLMRQDRWLCVVAKKSCDRALFRSPCCLNVFPEWMFRTQTDLLQIIVPEGSKNHRECIHIPVFSQYFGRPNSPVPMTKKQVLCQYRECLKISLKYSKYQMVNSICRVAVNARYVK